MQLPAIPCDKDRNFLPLHTKPTPLQPTDATDQKPWHLFDNCLAFDFANFQCVKLQASELKINCALDLWMAASLKANGNGDLPSLSAEEMYATIDAIQEGNTTWKMVTFRYNGPHPANPPKWMLETYELCMSSSPSTAVIHGIQRLYQLCSISSI